MAFNVGQIPCDSYWQFEPRKKWFRVHTHAQDDAYNPMLGWEAINLEAALDDAFHAAGVPWVDGGTDARTWGKRTAALTETRG